MAAPPDKKIPFKQLLVEARKKCGNTRVGTLRKKLGLPKLLDGKASDDDDLADFSIEVTTKDNQDLAKAIGIK